MLLVPVFIPPVHISPEETLSYCGPSMGEIGDQTHRMCYFKTASVSGKTDLCCTEQFPGMIFYEKVPTPIFTHLSVYRSWGVLQHVCGKVV